jgi:hypothetical protein
VKKECERREEALECFYKRKRAKDTGQGAGYSVQRRKKWKDMESAAREGVTDLEIRIK